MRKPVVILSILACLTTPSVADEIPPLLDLASRVPYSANMQANLADLSAYRSQLKRAVGTEVTRQFGSYSYNGLLFAPSFLNVGLLFGDIQELVGFSIESVDLVATWGARSRIFAAFVRPEAFDIAAGDRAMTANGLKRRRAEPIWTKDTVGPQSKKNTNLFSEELVGHSPSYAVDGNTFRFAVSLEDMLAMREVSSPLSRNPEFRAILGAIYEVDDLGPPTEVQAIVTTQVVRAKIFEEVRGRIPIDPAAFGDPFPQFREFAIVQWQNGKTLTGGLAFAFRSEAEATRAQAFLTKIGERPIVTSPRGESLSDRIRDPLRTRVVEMSGLHVVLLMASGQMTPKNGQVPVSDYKRNAYYRLYELNRLRNLPVILGR